VLAWWCFARPAGMQDRVEHAVEEELEADAARLLNFGTSESH
jgi:hypothetical protein